MGIQNNDIDTRMASDDLITSWYGKSVTHTQRLPPHLKQQSTANSSRQIVTYGDVISGRYRVAQPLGFGGFASVYSAFDLSLHRWVAVKVYNTASDGMLSYDEIMLQSSSQHPNLMPLYDAGTDPLISVTYIVMPLYPGADLRAVLDRYGQMPYRSALSCIEQICSALDYLNINRHALHGDVKPSNIWLTGSGAALLMDFNVYGILVRNPEWKVGTPGYTSPEAMQGLIDERSDVFSLGCVLYECITGNVPFGNDNALITGRYPAPSIYRPDIRPGLEAVIATALESDTSRRFQSPREFKIALRNPEAFRSSNPKIWNSTAIVMMWILQVMFKLLRASLKNIWKGIVFAYKQPLQAFMIAFISIYVISRAINAGYVWFQNHQYAIVVSGICVCSLSLVLFIAHRLFRRKFSPRYK